jgi:hypothetical protein
VTGTLSLERSSSSSSGTARWKKLTPPPAGLASSSSAAGLLGEARLVGVDGGLHGGDGAGQLLDGDDALRIGRILAEHAQHLLAVLLEHDHVAAGGRFEDDQHAGQSLQWNVTIVGCRRAPRKTPSSFCGGGATVRLRSSVNVNRG